MPSGLFAIERRALLGDNVEGLRLMRETEFWQAWESLEQKKRSHQRREAYRAGGPASEKGAAPAPTGRRPIS